MSNMSRLRPDTIVNFLTPSLDRSRRCRFMPATPSPRSVCTMLQEIWCRFVVLYVYSPNEPKLRVFPPDAIQVVEIAIAPPARVLDLIIHPSTEIGPSDVPELPMVSPFLCSDDSDSDLESEPADKIPERYVSLRLYDDVVSRCPIPPTLSIEIATTSLVCDTLTLVITASSAVHSRIRTTTRKSTFGLRPLMTPARSAAPRAMRASLSAPLFESSSSSSSSGSALHTSESSPTSLHDTQISSLEDSSHHSTETARTPSGPLNCTSSYDTPSSSTSTGPSRKKCRSSASSVPSTVHLVGALSPIRADILPPRKRTRDLPTAFSYELGDEGRLETCSESDTNFNVWADIAVDIAAAAGATAAIVDGPGIKPGLEVVEAESEPEEAECVGCSRSQPTTQALVVKKQSQNRDDDDNGNRGNGNRGNNNWNGNQNGGNGGARRNAPVTKACTYKDFLNCQPRNFSGTEGFVGLARWFEKMELVFRTISIDEAYEMSWRGLMKLMIDVYCSRNEIQKLENEL
ncbi:hypothetical protein Tco_1175697 [Tanacetum coccineum]